MTKNSLFKVCVCQFLVGQCWMCDDLLKTETDDWLNVFRHF